MSFHLDTIGSAQKKAFRALGPIATKHGFYLAGGTAVAFHLGHRHSVDFDFFTNEVFADPLGFSQRLRDAGLDFVTQQIAPGTLHGQVYNVRTSFLEYRYPLLQPLVYWPEFDCHLASLDDLVCMKLAAIAQRGAKKDFVDLFELARRHRSLAELLDLYREKYGIEDRVHLLYALSYFDDADKERMPKLLHDVSWKTMKTAIKQWVKEINLTD